MAEHGIRWSWDTFPHILTIILGLIVMFLCDIWWGIIYMAVIIFGMLWFWYSICTRCRAFDHPSCPSGYGIIASRLFNRRKGDFRSSFRRNIISVALQWFFPAVVGLIYVIARFSVLLLIFYIIFLLTAFLFLPLAARKKGCGTCPQRTDCPWKG